MSTGLTKTRLNHSTLGQHFKMIRTVFFVKITEDMYKRFNQIDG